MITKRIDQMCWAWATELSKGGSSGYPSQGNAWHDYGRPTRSKGVKRSRYDKLGNPIVSARGSQSSRQSVARVHLSVESEQLDAALNKLPTRLRNSVKVYYLNPSLLMTEKAALLKISDRTLRRHIHKAHEELHGLLSITYSGSAS